MTTSLVRHAEVELRRAGLFDKDSDYDGELAKSVMELIKVFSAQGHSGYSSAAAINLFGILGSFKALTPITSDPAEWLDRKEYCGYNMWQNSRDGRCFSDDGGKTHYNVDEKGRPVHKTAESK